MANPWSDWYTGDQTVNPELVAQEEAKEAEWKAKSIEEKIKELEHKSFLIQVGTDYMSKSDWDAIHKIEAEIKKLKEELNQ